MKKKETPNTLKFWVIKKKPWKATRKVTLRSNESGRKSQIGINPLNKFETRAKGIRSKEFYCLACRGLQDFNISIDLRNYKFINYFVRKQSKINLGVVLAVVSVHAPYGVCTLWVFSEKLDTSEMLFEQLVNFFTVTIMERLFAL